MFYGSNQRGQSFQALRQMQAKQRQLQAKQSQRNHTKYPVQQQASRLPLDVSTALNQQQAVVQQKGKLETSLRNIVGQKQVVSQAILETPKPNSIKQLIQKIRANDLNPTSMIVLQYSAPSILRMVRERKINAFQAVKALKSVQASLLAETILQIEKASAKDKRILRSAKSKIIAQRMDKLKECYAGFCHPSVLNNLKVEILVQAQDLAKKMDNPLLLNNLIDAVCYECELEEYAKSQENFRPVPVEESIEDADVAEIIDQGADAGADVGENLLQENEADSFVKRNAPLLISLGALTTAILIYRARS